MGAWIKTKRTPFDLEDPQPDMVFIEDIAESLSKLCRFSGHCAKFYSVAEHSIRVAFGEFDDPNETVAWFERFGLEGLLHDAAEAYSGHLTSPLKSLLPGIGAIERRIDAVIREKFGLPAQMSQEVAAADIRALAGESMQLCLCMSLQQWQQLEKFAWNSAIRHKRPPMSAKTAEGWFLSVFEHVASGHYMPPPVRVIGRKRRASSSRG
jgi:hypothetical protein